MHRIDKDRDFGSSGERRRAGKPPHLSLLALEPMRASAERLASVGVGPLLRYLPRGYSHPVLNKHQRPAIDVPVTCIYSRTDGMVSWPACAESLGSRRENIEIRRSHLGMTNDPAALIAIVDRLAQPVERWRKFASPPAMSWLYPAPRYWTVHPANSEACKMNGRLAAPALSVCLQFAQTIGGSGPARLYLRKAALGGGSSRDKRIQPRPRTAAMP